MRKRWQQGCPRGAQLLGGRRAAAEQHASPSLILTHNGSQADTLMRAAATWIALMGHQEWASSMSFMRRDSRISTKASNIRCKERTDDLIGAACHVAVTAIPT